MSNFERKLGKTRELFAKYKKHIPEDVYKESQALLNELEISEKKNRNGCELLLKLSDLISGKIKKESEYKFKEFSFIFSKRIRGVLDWEGQYEIVEKFKSFDLGYFSDGVCACLSLLHNLNINFDDGESINKKLSKLFRTKNADLQRTVSEYLCTLQEQFQTSKLTKSDLLVNYSGIKEEAFEASFNRFLVEAESKNIMNKEYTESKKIELTLSLDSRKGGDSGDIGYHAVSLRYIDESGWHYYDPNFGEFTFKNKMALVGFIESSYRDVKVGLMGAWLVGTSSKIYESELIKIESFFNEIKAQINEAAKNFDKSLGENGDVIEWETPSIEAFETILQEVIEYKKTTRYRKNLIVQLQSEEVVNDSVLNLLGKHPEQSALLQLDPDNKSLNVLLWDNETNDFRVSNIADWLTLDSEGMIRIQLVGHGVTKEGKTTLGGLDVAQLQQAIHPVLELLAKSGPHLKGLKISLVGCETLPAGGSLEQSLPAQLLQFIHNQLQPLELKDVHLQLTGRELLLQVNNDGHKLVNIDGKWVSKEVANLLGKQHKTTLLIQEGLVVVQAKSKDEVLALIEGMQAIKEPLSADDAALLEKIGASLQENIREVSGERHEQQTTRLLIQLDELLQLKGEVNDIFDLLQKDPELKGLKPTLEIDKAGKLLWIGANGEKKYIVLEREHYGKLERLASKTQQLLSEFQQHVSLDESGNISLKHDGQIALEQVEGGPATLNAAFLLQTLLGENPFNHGLDNVTVAMKIQTYAQLIQNTLGVAHDAVKVSELFLHAATADFKLASKLIGISNGLGSFGGGILDFINIGASLVQVFQAKDDNEKSQAITNLVGNIVPAGLNTAGLVAGLAGASSAASILGMIGVPVAGLALGVIPLVNIQEGYVDAFHKAKWLFTQLLNDYQDIATADVSDITGGSLVINGVNFKTGGLTLGKVKVGEYTWHNNVVDIYEGFGPYPAGSVIKNEKIAKADYFVLPGNVNVTYYSQGQYVLLGSYDGCDAFDLLHKKYGDKFKWIKKYGVQSDILNIMEVDYQETNIRIDLDDSVRNMATPLIIDDKHRNKLHYQLVGAGGSYTLSMSHLPMDVTITASSSEKEKWMVDVSHLIKEVKIENERVKVKEGLLSDIERRIDVQSDRLTVGSQTIRFDGDYRPNNLYLVSDLAMTNSAGVPVISPLSDDKKALAVRLVMQVDLVKDLIAQYALSFESFDEAAFSFTYLKQTLSPMVKKGLVALGLKNGGAHGFFDLDKNISIFLNERTGVMSYFDNGVLSEKVVFRTSYKVLDTFLGGKESAHIHYSNDGSYLTRTIFMSTLDKATVLSKVVMENGQFYLQTEMVSLPKESFTWFESLVLRQKEPLIGLAQLFGSAAEHLLALDMWKDDPIFGLDLEGLRQYREPAKEVNFTGRERITIENRRGQKMVFEYSMAQQQMQMKSAGWTISNATCNYNMFVGGAYLKVQGRQGVNELTLCDEDLHLDYAAAKTTMVVTVSKSTQNVSISVAANKYQEIVINGAGDNFSLYIGGIRDNDYGLMWDGQDLLIGTVERQQIRITNAWDIKRLQLGMSDNLQEVDKIASWKKNNQLHNIIASQFGREKVYGEYEIGSVRYFTGESGVKYEMRGQELRAIDYIGKEDLSLSRKGVRSLDLLDNILAGKTLFAGNMWNHLSIEELFPEKGQEALNMLVLLESSDVQDAEQLKGKILERIIMLKGREHLEILENNSAESLVEDVIDVSRSLLPNKTASCVPQSYPMASWDMPASYHLEKLVMAMNGLVGAGERGGWRGAQRVIDTSYDIKIAIGRE
ncbi:TcdA/TcdB pore-forming domain-containing protein [Aeromonas jandaei]|uniref:TcdA/TcdB pore-forming domain-containing protein n=1 Tax=Aeromonas jandaei TaxID=650 RepID=UPI003BA2BCBC